MTARVVPATFRKLVASRLSQKFREIVNIVEVPTPKLGDDEVLIRNRYLGINASDINFTAGRYDASTKPPFDCGFEALGEVAAVGPKSTLSVGQAVLYSQYGAFSEYKLMSSKVVFPIPEVNVDYLPMLVSGLTAAISLEKVGEIKAGETVLVTAAAGGTGQMAVQIAKNAGCHVIGTCSTEDKVQFLRDLGCDRPVNYKKEDLKQVLKKEYPKGIDVVYESIGGEMFDLALNSLAKKGRLIVIGFITAYETDLGFKPSRTMATLPVRLLQKSTSLRGFFLNDYVKDWPAFIMKQIQWYKQGKLRSFVDLGQKAPTGPFEGLEKVTDAVEYLYTQKSIGKIVVEVNNPASRSKL